MHTRSRVLLLPLIGCLFLLSGCATTGLRYAMKERYVLTDVVEVRGATVADDSVYVSLRARLPKQSEIQERVLRIPLASEEWPPGEGAASPSKERSPFRYWSGYKPDFRLRMLPSSSLLPAEAMPADGAAVPLRKLTLEELKSLAPGAGEAGDDVKLSVLSLTEEEAADVASRYLVDSDWLDPIYSEEELTTRPLLAVGTAGDPPAVFDLYDRFGQQKAWYLLMPLAVATDVVTSPVQGLFFLVVLLVMPP